MAIKKFAQPLQLCELLYKDRIGYSTTTRLVATPSLVITLII